MPNYLKQLATGLLLGLILVILQISEPILSNEFSVMLDRQNATRERTTDSKSTSVPDLIEKPLLPRSDTVPAPTAVPPLAPTADIKASRQKTQARTASPSLRAFREQEKRVKGGVTSANVSLSISASTTSTPPNVIPTTPSPASPRHNETPPVASTVEDTSPSHHIAPSAPEEMPLQTHTVATSAPANVEGTSAIVSVNLRASSPSMPPTAIPTSPSQASPLHNETPGVASDMEDASPVALSAQKETPLQTHAVATAAPVDVTLVMEMAGELGNNLGELANAYGLKWALEDAFPFNVTVVGQHQDRDKWTRGAHDLHTCFSNFKNFNFEMGRWDQPAFAEVSKLQEDWMDKLNATLTLPLGSPASGCTSDDDARMCVQSVGSLLQRMIAEQKENPDDSAIQKPPGSNYSLPFLKVAKQVKGMRDSSQLRELFAYRDDNVECCASKPDPDETVFHLRNFYVENNNLYRVTQYVEMTPNQTAEFFLGSVEPESKVAVVARFASDPRTAEYVQALSDQGFQVRLLTNHTGVQDFCFLLHTQKELIASRQSTFAAWASTLRDFPITRVSMKVVDSVAAPFRPTPHPRHSDATSKKDRTVAVPTSDWWSEGGK